MSGSLVNAFGKIALDETNRDANEILEAILLELKKMNVQLAEMTGEELNDEYIDGYGE